MHNDDLVYRFEGKFSELIPIGPVVDGLRMQNHFGGKITYGELTGATVSGVDYFRVRADGVGVVDAHELVVADGSRIGVRVTGYVLPPEGAPAPSAEEMAAPGFAWPDVPLTIECFATFHTADPRLAHLNRLTVVHSGYANMAANELYVEAHKVKQHERILA